MLGRRRAGPRKVFQKEDGSAVAAAVFSVELRPGLHIGVLYTDDPGVWHERLLLWPLGGTRRGWWVILTPDADCYAEPLDGGRREDGPARLALIGGLGGARPPELDGGPV